MRRLDRYGREYVRRATVAAGDAYIESGLNVGTATGAAAGEVRTSGSIRGGASLGLGGTYGAVMRMNYIEGLGDDANANLRPDGGLAWGLIMIICSSEVSVCLAVRNGGFTIVSDPNNAYSTTDTDGKHCLLNIDGDDRIKNRRGAPRTYRVHLLGF